MMAQINIRVDDTLKMQAESFETFTIQENEWTEEDEANFDAWVVEEIKNNPDCHEFIPASELYADLGISEGDIKK